jgi:hypothetical protein
MHRFRFVEHSYVCPGCAVFARLRRRRGVRTADPGEGTADRLTSRSVLGVSVWDSKMDAERYSREYFPEIENMLRPFLKCAPRLRTFDVREIREVAVLNARSGAKPTSLLVQ